MTYKSAAVALAHCCLLCSCTCVLEPDPAYSCIRPGLRLPMCISPTLTPACIWSLPLPSTYLPELVLPVSACFLMVPWILSMPASDHLLPTWLFWPRILCLFCSACTCLAPAGASSIVGHQSSCTNYFCCLLLPAATSPGRCCFCQHPLSSYLVHPGDAPTTRKTV